MANPIISFFKWAGSKIAEAWAGAELLGKINMVLTAATLAVGVKGFMQAKQMMAKGQDILANKTSAGGKLPIIYGTRRVGAQVIYMDVSANDSRDLYVVYALSVGECDEILGRTIELDGNPLTDSARFRDGGYIGSDKITSGNYSLNTVSQNGTGIDAGAGQFGSSPTSKYRYVMNLHHGAATQTADPMLVASMPNWTSAHKLNGVCYIAAHYGYDKEGIWKGVPQLTVQVRGKKVFDPRDTNQTFGTVSTYKYSDNPALTFLDYITNNEYGKGLTQSQINMTTFSSAANVCDTQVDQPYFNGSAQSLTWSGNAGDDFITIGGTDPNTNWWQNKVGEIVDINDANGNLIVDGKEIKDVQRNGFYDQNDEYIVYINDTLGSTYSSQTGSSLVKVKRFHCNGYLDSNKNVMDNAKELLANMRGIFLYINGKYELSIEDTGTSTFSINDNHIIADAGISVDYGNKDKKANKVIVEFFNANKRYELDTATVLHDATPEYYSDDGDEILEIKAEFPYISDPYIAYNMGKAILTRSRNQTSMQFLGTPEMYKLNVGDIVDLTYAGLGFSGKICRVEALELQHSGLVSVSLIEYFDVYTWEVPPQEPVEELANLPSAYAVKAPTGLSFTDSDSSATGRPFLSWNEPTDFPDYQYRVNVVDSSNNQVINRIVDVENCDLNFVPTGSYVANVTSLNTLGTESSPARFPTTGTFTIGDAPTATADIKDDAIVTDKILNNAVTDAKINSLTANKLTAGTIDASVITVTNLDADNITSGTIGADKIVVDDLSAINSDLGDIDAGSLNIGSGAFTVSTAGVISATSGEVGGFTLGSTSLTNTAADSKIQIGSGSDVFTVDGDGIYLGNTSFASAPFKALNTGEVQTTKSFTAGVAGSGEIAKMAGTGDYRFWSGNEAPANASFSVDKAGKVIAKNLVLKLTDGTVYFDSETGFSNSALSQISLTTGTKVSTVSNTFDADTEYEEITVTEDTDVDVSVSIDTNFGGNSDDSSTNTAIDESEAEIPENFTLTIQHSSDGGSNYTTVVTDTFTRVNDRLNPKTTPLSDEYKINTETEQLFIGGQGGVIIIATTTTSLNLGCVDSDGRTILTSTGLTLTGISTGTTHRIKATVSTTDTSYDTTNNNVSSTAPRVVSITDPSGDGFYVGDGSGSQVAPEGDITRVQITTAPTSGLTGGANFASGDALFSLALGSTFAGNKTFSNNVVIQGDLDVQGTTTTIDTTNLDVKDKNITLNYGTGDTSANANGAGFTIQDAVSAGNDASLTWTTANDTFNLSHPLSITGALTLNNTAISGVNQLAFNDPGVNEGIEWTGGNTKIFESPDNLTNAAGNLQVTYGGTRRLTVNSSGIDVNGVITIPATANFEIDITGSLAGNIRANGDLFLLSQTGNLNLGAGGTNSQLSIATNGNATFTGTISSGAITSSGLTVDYTGNRTGDAGILVTNDASDWGIKVDKDGTADYGILSQTDGENAVVVRNAAGVNKIQLQGDGDATFAGTISSGAITAPSLNSTGTVTINSTGSGATLTVNRVSGQPSIKAGTDDAGYLIMDSSGGNAALNWYTSDNVVLALGGGKVGVGDNTPTQKLDVNGNIGIGGTEIITSSRNLTNIGTISSGAIQGSSTIDSTNVTTGTFRVYDGSTFRGGLGTGQWASGLSSQVGNWSLYAVGTLNFHSNNSGTPQVTQTSSGFNSTIPYQINGSTVIDASKNITAGTGYITGTRLRVGDGTDGFFYSDTAGRTAFSSGEFYIQTSVPNFYNYATNQYYGGTSGDTIHFRGNVVTANNWGIPASGTITSTGIRTGTGQARVKLGVWSDTNYGIGMQNGYTYGGLNNDYAMSFQMNNDNDRGFWWGDTTHTNAQGAMALTTQGRLTVAEGIRVGYGETDTTIPSAGLAVNGSIASGTINTTSHITIGTISTTNTGSLFLAGSTANKKAELKCTNGNLHIDPDTANGLYLNYYKGTGGIFFGNGASSYRALMNTSGHLNLASTGASPTGYALAIGNVGVIDTSRNLTNIGTGNFAGNITVDYTGNSTNDAGIYVANDNSDWGIYINKDGSATYGLKISADGAYPFQIVNSSQVEKFRVDADGDIETVRNINASGTIDNAGAITSSSYVSIKNAQFLYFGQSTSAIGSWTSRIYSNGSQQRFNAGSFSFSREGYATDEILNLTSGSVQIGANKTLQMNGTTVIDASRNLTNIGTIQTTSNVLIGGSFAGNSYAYGGARLLFHGGNSDSLTNYYIGTNLENVGGNYSKLDLRWHTGIRMGAQGVYGGIRFYNNEDLTSKLMSIGEGSGVTDVKVYNDLNVVSNIEINGTTVIDASRNLTNIGTISSGAITASGDITAGSGTLTVQATGYGGGQIGLGDWSNGNPIGISEGLWNTVTTDNDYLTVYTRSSFNIRGYGGGTTHWLSLTNSNLNLVQGQSLSLAGTTVIDASRNFSGQSYSGASNSANFAANTVTSYATWKTSGSKGGYDGIVFDSGGDVAVMFDSAGNGGFYRQANSRWYQYHLVGNNCTGFGASTTSSAYQIYVTGAIYSTDNITAYSDRRIKENIVTIDKPLTKVEGLRGVYYNKIDDIDKTKQIGFIAQEVDEVVPELVTYAEDVDQYGVNYGNATALLVEAIKELSQQVKDQQKQIDELKQRLDNDSSN